MSIRLLTALILPALLAALLGWYFYCPCERTPGGYLIGRTAGPVQDWSFVNDRDAVPLCQIEVRRIVPHSVNLNCMAADGAAYLSCAECAGKAWSTAALGDSRARLRAGGVVYPVTVARVTDEAELDRAWTARAAKTGRPAGERSPGWWSFRVRSR
jgi:hypothetical protein